MRLLESIWDRIFWAFVLTIAMLLALVIIVVDFFLECFFHEEYNRFFEARADSAIESYQAFRRDHPVICWCLQFPLLAVGM